MTEFYPLGRLKSEIGDALCSLGGLREFDGRQNGDVVVGLLIQSSRKPEFDKKRFSRSANLIVDLCER